MKAHDMRIEPLLSLSGAKQPSSPFFLIVIIAKSLRLAIAVLLLSGALMTAFPVLPASAQAEVRYGLKGGLSRATVAGTDFSSIRNGFVLGGFMRVDFPLFVSAQIEGLFTQKGYALKFDQFIDLDGTILLGNVDADVQLNYF